MPSQFWIGNTNPTTDSIQIKNVLMQCAASLSVENFDVLDVRCLTNHENPRSKSWKVSVPSRFKETMMNPDMYYDGWTHRVFTVRSDTRRNTPAGRRDSHGAATDGSSRSKQEQGRSR